VDIDSTSPAIANDVNTSISAQSHPSQQNNAPMTSTPMSEGMPESQSIRALIAQAVREGLIMRMSAHTTLWAEGALVDINEVTKSYDVVEKIKRLIQALFGLVFFDAVLVTNGCVVIPILLKKDKRQYYFLPDREMMQVLRERLVEITREAATSTIDGQLPDLDQLKSGDSALRGLSQRKVDAAKKAYKETMLSLANATQRGVTIEFEMAGAEKTSIEAPRNLLKEKPKVVRSSTREVGGKISMVDTRNRAVYLDSFEIIKNAPPDLLKLPVGTEVTIEGESLPSITYKSLSCTKVMIRQTSLELDHASHEPAQTKPASRQKQHQKKSKGSKDSRPWL
jgi:hypothetical protein